tara:strand:+ start:1289 stop:1522 length:234 start_codon:yes stop_codon:yes gene_type:complete
MIVSNERYSLELVGSLGTVYGDGKLLFKGFSGTAIKEYLRYVPEHKEKFRGQLAHKKKLDLAKDYDEARLKAKDKIK